MKKQRLVLLSISFFLLLSGVCLAETPLKIGYVNMNQAINTSKEGQRSKKFLESQAQRTRQMLKAKEQEIMSMERELEENIMLSSEAKAQKQLEISRRKEELREELQKAQADFRKDEARHTNKIINDLVSIVKRIGEEEGYDVILEFNIQQTILYSRFKMNDLTDRIIKEYDRIQSLEP